MFRFAGLALACGLALPAFAQPVDAPTQAPTQAPLKEPNGSAERDEHNPQSEIALADFDAVWSIVQESYYDTEMGGLDWEGVRDELRPRAAEAKTARERRRIINQMVARLGQSHFGLISAEAANPPELVSTDDRFHDAEHPDADESDADTHNDKAWAPAEAWDRAPAGEGSDGLGDPGIVGRIVEGALIVTRVVPGSAADEAGVKPGWEIALVAGVAVDELAARLVEDLDPHTASLYGWMMTRGMLEGAPGTKVRVGLIDLEGKAARLVLERGEVRGPVAKFGNLPAMVVEVEHRWLTPEEHGQGDDKKIGYISMSTWMLQARAAFDRAMLEFQDADGLVFDLRGNPGGIAGLAPGIAGYFLDEQVSLGDLVMRDNTLTFNARPVRSSMQGDSIDPFTGRLAIVQDELSASTSEIFAAGVRAIDRVRIFGARSAGQALPALPTRLPSGDVLMHVIANYIPPEGVEAPEGGGVVPDVYIPLTRESVSSGEDAALIAAAAWAAGGTLPTSDDTSDPESESQSQTDAPAGHSAP